MPGQPGSAAPFNAKYLLEELTPELPNGVLHTEYDSFLSLSDTPNSYAGQGSKFLKVNAGETAIEFSASSVSAHDILSDSHSDVLSGAVQRGDLIIGNSTPKWARLAKGSSAQFLKSDGTDLLFATILWSEIDKTTSSISDIATKGHSLLSGIGANDHHNQSHALSGGDHSGVLAETQLPAGGAWALTSDLKISGTNTLLVVSQNAAALPAPTAGTVLQIGAADGVISRFLIDAFGGVTPGFTMRVANGTAASPSATLLDDPMFNIVGIGHGATAYVTSGRVAITGYAAENWTDSAHGTYFAIWTTPTGSTTLTRRFDITANGNVGIGTSSQFGSGALVIGIANAVTAPSTNPSGGGVLYAQAGAGKWRSSGGTITTFGPAEPHCPICGKDFILEWKNEKTGHLIVCLWCLTEKIKTGLIKKEILTYV